MCLPSLTIGSSVKGTFCSPRKDEIILFLMYAMSLNGMKEVLFFFNNEIELHECTTHASMKKKGVVKPPIGETKQMTIASFEQYVREKLQAQKEIDLATEMLISNGQNKLTINNFNLLKTLGKGGFGKVYLVEKKDTKELFALKTIKKLIHNRKETV
jgi:serum/glucocorticoid-regulated kinase 2